MMRTRPVHPVWTVDDTFRGDPLDRPLDGGRYSYGACNRGLPWVDFAQTVCSGDCHPDAD